MKILKPAEAFDKSAKIYESKFMDVGMFAEGLNLFCDGLPANAHVLDIACGPGNITRYLLDKRPDFDMLGLDLSANMLELARVNVPSARFELMDCREISSIEQRFEGIVCGFCLPYLTQEEAAALIGNVAALLNPGGMFYLSTMEENEESKSRYQVSSTGDKVYVHYHQGAYLTKALCDSGFDIIDVKRFNNRDKDGIMITDLVLIGRLAA